MSPEGDCSACNCVAISHLDACGATEMVHGGVKKPKCYEKSYNINMQTAHKNAIINALWLRLLGRES